MGKLIPLINCQKEERIFVVAGCSWYLDEVERMHVSCQSVWMRDILGKGYSNQVLTTFMFCNKTNKAGICSSVLKCPPP